MSFIVVLLTLSACVTISTCKNDTTAAGSSSETLNEGKKVIPNHTKPTSSLTPIEREVVLNNNEPTSTRSSSKTLKEAKELSPNNTGPTALLRLTLPLPTNSTIINTNETEKSYTPDNISLLLDDMRPRNLEPQYGTIGTRNILRPKQIKLPENGKGDQSNNSTEGSAEINPPNFVSSSSDDASLYGNNKNTKKSEMNPVFTSQAYNRRPWFYRQGNGFQGNWHGSEGQRVDDGWNRGKPEDFQGGWSDNGSQGGWHGTNGQVGGTWSRGAGQQFERGFDTSSSQTFYGSWQGGSPTFVYDHDRGRRQQNDWKYGNVGLGFRKQPITGSEWDSGLGQGRWVKIGGVSVWATVKGPGENNIGNDRTSWVNGEYQQSRNDRYLGPGQWQVEGNQESRHGSNRATARHGWYNGGHQTLGGGWVKGTGWGGAQGRPQEYHHSKRYQDGWMEGNGFKPIPVRHQINNWWYVDDGRNPIRNV